MQPEAGSMTIEKVTYAHILEVGRLMSVLTAEMSARALTHDKSKMLVEDARIYARMAKEMSGLPYGTPAYKAVFEKYRLFIRNHHISNRHHPEYFSDGIRGMNLVDLSEMLCDWIASRSKNRGGSILRSIDVGQKRFGFSDELRAVLLNTVVSFFREAPGCCQSMQTGTDIKAQNGGKDGTEK
jgi:hypothetical protein